MINVPLSFPRHCDLSLDNKNPWERTLISNFHRELVLGVTREPRGGTASVAGLLQVEAVPTHELEARDLVNLVKPLHLVPLVDLVYDRMGNYGDDKCTTQRRRAFAVRRPATTTRSHTA